MVVEPRLGLRDVRFLDKVPDLGLLAQVAKGEFHLVLGQRNVVVEGATSLLERRYVVVKIVPGRPFVDVVRAVDAAIPERKRALPIVISCAVRRGGRRSRRKVVVVH